MAITDHERVGKAMDLLKEGLAPFIEREFVSACIPFRRESDFGVTRPA